MGTGKRAYDILRGYIGKEYERLSGLDQASAEAELDETMRTTRNFTHTESTPQQTVTTDSPDAKQHAARILGVSITASYEEVKVTFDKLSKRSDPKNFPEGSSEREQAAVIQRRIYWAFQVLSQDVDSTEKRFRSLEIE